MFKRFAYTLMAQDEMTHDLDRTSNQSVVALRKLARHFFAAVKHVVPHRCDGEDEENVFLARRTNSLLPPCCREELFFRRILK